MEDNTATPQQGHDKAPAQQSDARYLLVVCGLLLLIIILLSYLWIKEKRTNGVLVRRVEAMSQLQTMANRGQLERFLAAQNGASATPLDRGELATRVVDFDGESRTVMLVGAAAGRRIGLQPGDVIVVSPPPTTQPTTRAGAAEPPNQPSPQ